MIDLNMPIRQFEEFGMTALPALHTVYYDGWVLRFAGGHTRRANSVNPLYFSTLDLDEKIDCCAALYRQQNLPLVFKMTDAVLPADLDSQLAARGFEATSQTSLQISDLSALNGQPPEPAVIQSQRSEPWLDAYVQMNEVPPQRRAVLAQMLDAILTPTAYAAVEQEGRIVAVGLGVVTQGYVGLFDIVTDPRLRKQGLGRRVVDSLLRWGQARGAHHAYLQVVAENAPAIGLYEKFGFREFYRYWYRVRNQ